MDDENSDYMFSFGSGGTGNTSKIALSDNTITTTKYTLLSWAPKSILIQFKRVANIYFLVITVLTFFYFSPKKPASMTGTFTAVLIATMIKEALEDYARYKQDKANNYRTVDRLEEGCLRTVKWYQLKAGDIIKLDKEAEMPADGVIFKCSNESGFCYIDTKNLDGETNLKDKLALEAFQNMGEEGLNSLSGQIKTEKPNENLISLEGWVESQETVRFDLKNVILKGCSLKNTEYVYCLVIYAGKNTKIMKNAQSVKAKMSNVLKKMNKYLYSLFCFQLFICGGLGTASFFWTMTNEHSHKYIFSKGLETPVYFQIIVNFLTYLVAYSHLIPISLYVTLEIIKVVQGKLIFYDSEMFDIPTRNPAVCRATDLVEELGQIDFIFSDKTGTLTQNVMILRKCYVGGRIFGGLADCDEKEEGSLAGDMEIASLFQENSIYVEPIKRFFTHLSVCHDVFPDKTKGKLVYQGASPDDVALVEGAHQIGIQFSDVNFSTLTVKDKINEEVAFYERLLIIPFDSDRKRMSVICKENESNRIVVYTKGADTTMIPLIDWKEDEKSEMNKTSNMFAKEGLRVLLIAEKELKDNVYSEWKERYDSAQNAGEDLAYLYAELERDLEFVGCSAIEDKLQEGVADTISTLIDCNIRLWVLTGDKQDTAEEIAKSCSLIKPSMFLLNLSSGSEEELASKLEEIFEEYNMDKKPFDIEAKMKYIKIKEEKEMSLIIDGLTLAFLLDNEELKEKFIKISLVSKSVVCCRVSPSQKASVVSMVKKYGKYITLSIGDGANDVPMILEAHIGVGIQGKEGTQAVRSADFAIGQFRFLRKLLLHYGRNGYMKVSKFICYYFYKNIIVVFTEIYFSVFCGFSGQIFFADYLSTLYNAVFTSWPCLFTFVFEKDLDLDKIIRFPVLYGAGQKNYYFNLKVYWLYILSAVFHGTLCFFVPLLMLGRAANDDGLRFGHWIASTVSFTMIIHVVTYKLLVVSEYWNIMNISSAVLSVGIYYLTLWIMTLEPVAYILQVELAGVLEEILFSYKGNLLIFLMPIGFIAPDMFLKHMCYIKFPNPTYYVMNALKRPEMFEVGDEEEVKPMFEDEENKALRLKPKDVQTESSFEEEMVKTKSPIVSTSLFLNRNRSK